MSNPIHILLQTTIPSAEDDWNIDRFSLLADHLASIKDESGARLYEVTKRNRETNAQGDDVVLSELHNSHIHQLWLFAVEVGQGLTTNDCSGITRFYQRGGGLLTTRDHQDLGASLCTLGGIGRAHFFHSNNLDPDQSRHVADDHDTTSISWPNYHSGSNGNYQKITPTEPLHELLRNEDNASGAIEYFPAHPHEGSVGVPEGEDRARVIATGRSQTTGRDFNLIVALERTDHPERGLSGRAIAESSFHHFVDYNWDTLKGCPSFLLEPPGDEIHRDPAKLNDVKTYVRNVARWLTPAK
ncbi:MAG TPA: hypothetical protein VFD62_15780 [Pyrinomonadaceae bacterium]|nr:hypothetical protein [Pyrinomonadaceae bacterium]